MEGQKKIIVGLDIGTTKICAVVGEVSGDEINIIGIGTHPSIGLRKGVVVNIESTVESIKKAVEEADAATLQSRLQPQRVAFLQTLGSQTGRVLMCVILCWSLLLQVKRF
jgi:Ethanolamine utilization protein EutJ (predicted chaperonin)